MRPAFSSVSRLLTVDRHEHVDTAGVCCSKGDRINKSSARMLRAKLHILVPISSLSETICRCNVAVGWQRDSTCRGARCFAGSKATGLDGSAD